MRAKKMKSQNYIKPVNKSAYNEKKLFEDKLYINQYSKIIDENSKLNLEKTPKKNFFFEDEEDNYNSEIYDLSLSKDNNFLNNMIYNEEPKKNINLKKYLTGKSKVIENNSVFNNFNEIIDLNLNNINLFIKLNQENKNKIIDDYKSIENGSGDINNKFISKFSKNYKKNKINSKLILHSRFASQPLLLVGPYLRKNPIQQNLYNKYLQYNTNENSKINFTNNSLIKKRNLILEEKYLFDSNGNQRFLCVKRNTNNSNNKNNIIISSPKKIIKNKRHLNHSDIKQIIIKNINININSQKNATNNLEERIVFYSPQMSYNNIFSPNKNYINNLYKKKSFIKKVPYSYLIKGKKDINISHSYNVKFMNSFNKIINSDKDININYKSNIKKKTRNNSNNKIFSSNYLNNNFNDIKIDYSQRSNNKYHEIRMDNYNHKINNSTSMDNIKILNKYNNKYKIMFKDNSVERKESKFI